MDEAARLELILFAICMRATGVAVTQVREDIRTVDAVARTSGANRLDPTKLLNMTSILIHG